MPTVSLGPATSPSMSELNRRVLTIDGPAGSGKSTTARAIAEALGWRFLDTGATYRAMTVALLAAIRQRLRGELGREPTEADAHAHAMSLPERQVESYLEDVRLDVQWTSEGGIAVSLDDVPVPERDLRAEAVSRAIKVVADNPAIRRRLVDLQRRLAAEHPVVTEGRDQGSVAFPNAAYKFYFYASIEERARRRHTDALARGEQTEFLAVQRDIAQRDEADRTRPVGRLLQPNGAIVVNTTSLSRDEVVANVLQHVRRLEDESAPREPARGASPTSRSGRYPVAGEEEAT